MHAGTLDMDLGGIFPEEEEEIFWYTPEGHSSVTPTENKKTVILETVPNPYNKDYAYFGDFYTPVDSFISYNVTLLQDSQGSKICFGYTFNDPYGGSMITWL